MTDQKINDLSAQNKPPENIEKLLNDLNDIQSSIKEYEKDLTILFTDIRGSAEYFDRKGDVDGLLLLQKHNQLLFPIVKQEGGEIVKTIGDAIMASFENPVSAVQAAELMQRTLFYYNLDKSEREQIHIRIGLNTGKGFLKDKDVFGGVVNVAARIESLAGPDEILISEATHRTIKDVQRFKSYFLKRTKLKGIKKEIGIYNVFYREREDILPFDTLVKRYENAKSLKERHRNAMLLLDSMIRLFAIIALKCFLRVGTVNRP